MVAAAGTVSTNIILCRKYMGKFLRTTKVIKGKREQR